MKPRVEYLATGKIYTVACLYKFVGQPAACSRSHEVQERLPFEVEIDECDTCAGQGKYDCEECEGTGETPCPTCDDGTLECDECGGECEIRCKDCDGRGRKEYKTPLVRRIM